MKYSNFLSKVLVTLVITSIFISIVSCSSKVTPGISSSTNSEIKSNIDVSGSDNVSQEDPIYNSDGTLASSDLISGMSDSSGSTTGSTTGSTAGNSTITSSIPKDPSLTTGRVTNLNGRTVTYGYNQWFEAPDASTTRGQAILKHYAAIEKKLNCKIVWNPNKKTYEQVLTSIASGKPEVDIIAAPEISSLFNYYKNNQVVALDGLKVVDFNDRTKYTTDITYGVFKGSHYGLSVRSGGEGIKMLFYRKDLLKKAGYTPESLQALQDSKQWTWTKFQEVCEKVKAANGGIKAVSDGDLNFYNALLASNGADWIVKSSTGNYQFVADSPKATEVMNYYTKLTKLGLINNNEAGEVWDVWYDIGGTAGGTSAFFVAWPAMAFIPQFMTNIPWGAMYPPKPDNATAYATPNPVVGFWAIAAGTSKPAEVATVMDEMIAPYQTEAQYSADKKALYQSIVSDQYSLNNILNSTSISRFTYFSFASAANITKGTAKDGWNYQVGKIANGNITLAQAVTANKSKYNTIINNTFNK